MTPLEGDRVEVIGTLLAKLRLASITNGLTPEQCRELYNAAKAKIDASLRRERERGDETL